MHTVPPLAPPVHTEPAPRLDLASPWLLGHAFGTHGEPPRLPAEYDEAQAASFREGWRAGDAGRRLTRGWPRELVADDLGEFLAERHKDDHDQQPDPYAIEAWALLNDEYYAACADLAEGHAEALALVEEEWDARARRQGPTGLITDADVAPLGVL